MHLLAGFVAGLLKFCGLVASVAVIAVVVMWIGDHPSTVASGIGNVFGEISDTVKGWLQLGSEVVDG